MCRYLFLSFFLLQTSLYSYSQLQAKHNAAGNMLQRSLPEQQGVSSAAVIDFLDAAGKSKHEFHSFIFLRQGKIVEEGWWDPYKPGMHPPLY